MGSNLVGDFLVKRLAAWGIKRIYGYPGDGINGIMGALDRAGDLMKFVQVRHEEMAAFMACAHSKFTGEVGVCLATSGPGAIHLLNGLYDAKLRRAANVLNSGKKVAMLIGAGALGAADEVVEVADLLGAGVAKALLGKAALPDDLPFVTGAIGLLGTKPSWIMMNDCDTLLMVGSSFPYSEWLPKPGQARGVQIDIKGTMLNIRYPMELGLVGDAKETLKALSPLLDHKEDRSWREQLEGEIQEWWRLVEERAMQDADPINPQRIFWE